MRLLRLPGTEFRSGRYRQAARTPFFSVKIKANGKKEWRMGVVAGVAVDKKAAERNFLKRQVRETIRAALARDSGQRKGEGAGCDLLIILYSKAKELTKKEFKKKIEDAAMAAAKMVQ